MHNFRKFLPVLATALALTACDDGAGSGPDRGGRLTIQLTDAPGDFEAVFVKIERVILIRSAQDTSASGRVVLTPDTGFISVLALSGGKILDLVDEADVPEGTYSEVRFVLDEAFVVLKDDRVFATPGASLPAGVTADGELKCPSCSQSGFKLKFSTAGLVVNDETIVLVDFDVDHSFGHEAGNSGKLIMHPVLHATARNIALGRIGGTVSLATGVTLPACGGQPTNRSVFRPRAATALDTITGVTDTLGVFRITNLMPGAYTLGHVRDITYANGDSLTLTAAATPPSVVVPPGDSALATYQISAASCH